MWSHLHYQSLLAMLAVESGVKPRRRDQPLIDRIRKALDYLKARKARL